MNSVARRGDVQRGLATSTRGDSLRRGLAVVTRGESDERRGLAWPLRGESDDRRSAADAGAGVRASTVGSVLFRSTSESMFWNVKRDEVRPRGDPEDLAGVNRPAAPTSALPFRGDAGAARSTDCRATDASSPASDPTLPRPFPAAFRGLARGDASRNGCPVTWSYSILTDTGPVMCTGDAAPALPRAVAAATAHASQRVRPPPPALPLSPPLHEPACWPLDDVDVVVAATGSDSSELRSVGVRGGCSSIGVAPAAVVFSSDGDIAFRRGDTEPEADRGPPRGL